MKLHTSTRMPVIASRLPRTSSGARSASRDSSMLKSAPRAMPATSGTLMRKIAPQSKCRSIHPPTTGPMATPMPLHPAHTPIARRRRRGSGKACVRIASVAGNTIAAPTPIAARHPTRAPGVPANAAPTEVTPKTATPSTSSRRRPKRSAALPMVSNSVANTRMYASTIHCSWLFDAPPSARTRVGSATLTIDPSMTIRVTASATVMSAHRRRRPMTATPPSFAGWDAG